MSIITHANTKLPRLAALVGLGLSALQGCGAEGDQSLLTEGEPLGEHSAALDRGQGATLKIDGASSIQQGVSQPNTFSGAGVTNLGLVGSGISIQSGYAQSPFRLPVGNGPFTISLWMRSNRSVGIDTLLDQRTETPQATNGVSVYTINGGLGVQLSSGPVSNFETNRRVTDGQWHQIVVSYTPGVADGLVIYIDGFLTNRFTPSINPAGLATNAPLRLGARSWQTTGATGTLDLDEVYFYPSAASWERVVTDSKRPASIPGARGDSANDACSDILGQGIYNRLQQNVSESTVATATAWACSEVKKNRKTGVSISILDYVGVGFQSQNKDYEKFCQDNYSNNERDYTYDLQLETIDPNVVEAWKTCMLRQNEGFACWPSVRDGDIALDVTYDTTFGPTQVNLEYPTLRNLAPIGQLPTFMGEGKQSMLFDVTAKPADLILRASALRGGPGSATWQTTCTVNVPKDPPPTACVKDTVSVSVDMVKITRGGDRGSRGNANWFIEVDKTGDGQPDALLTDSVIYNGPYKRLIGGWQSPLYVPGLPRTYDFELNTSTNPCFRLRGRITDYDNASVDETARTPEAEYCWDAPRQEWTLRGGPDGSQDVMASYDWFLEAAFKWRVGRTKCND